MERRIKIVFDIEADGLLAEATKIHCLVAKDIESGKLYSFYDDDSIKPIVGKHFSIDRIPDLFRKIDLVIGHNIINFDLPILKKFFGITQTFEIVDTLVWSKVLYPDRPPDKGQPTLLFNPITGKNEKIGPHSLAAWGYRLKHPKVEYFDWREFDEDMLRRGTDDVLLNEKVYLQLLAEAGLT